MPGWSLVVTPKDPAAMRDLQATKRNQRLGVVLLSVLMITTGTVLTWRMIGKELEVARMKAEFAANVSHELRSPITNIRLKGEFLQLGLVEEEEDLQNHYDAIVSESERLSRLVDNVLDFASIEQGAKKYALRPGDLLETIRMSVESSRYTMETRGIVMDLTLPDDLPAVDHDAEAIRQVIQNLISNASKYGEAGAWIGIECRYDEEFVRVIVTDKGLGISEEELPQIFDRFFRSRDKAARRKKGTGIGLTIVRYIMEAHHGTVSVASEIGVGTAFTLHFPLPATAGTSSRLG
jgi:two-component system phosphate regulon sensor histidine kinase PhoR